MAIVAYSGRPDDRVFTRTTFSTWEQARIAAWHDGFMYDLHDTDEARTHWDEEWDSLGESLGEPVKEAAGQLDLFGA